MSDRNEVRALARLLRVPGNLDPLLERFGGVRIVLPGEASHGTHEYWFHESPAPTPLAGAVAVGPEMETYPYGG